MLFGITVISELVAKLPYYQYIVAASAGLMIGELLAKTPFGRMIPFLTTRIRDDWWLRKCRIPYKRND
jgi:hypothetical protein